MALSKRIGLREGYILLTIKSDTLIIEARDLAVELRPRTIVIKNSIKGFEEKEVGKTRKKKILYISLGKPITPFKGRGEAIKETIIGNYEIHRQDLGFDEYVTIITPGTHLYDYIILSSDTITISLSGKKQVYFDKEDSILTIYVV